MKKHKKKTDPLFQKSKMIKIGKLYFFAFYGDESGDIIKDDALLIDDHTSESHLNDSVTTLSTLCFTSHRVKRMRNSHDDVHAVLAW